MTRAPGRPDAHIRGLRDQGLDAADAGRLLAELEAEAATMPRGVRLAAATVDMVVIIANVTASTSSACWRGRSGCRGSTMR